MKAQSYAGELPAARFRARSPYEAVSLESIGNYGITATDRDGVGLAMVAVRNGRLPALTAVVQEELDLELPTGPKRMVSGKLAFSGIGPETWLAEFEGGGNGFAEMLKRKFGDLASVSDWSDGYAVLRLTGRNLRDALAKIVPIDLHPRVFKPGTVACTQPHGAILWHPGDVGDGPPAIEVAVARSFAGEFWHELFAGAAGCG